jgi:hypothetical protein
VGWKYINAGHVSLSHNESMLLIYSRNSSLNHAKKVATPMVKNEKISKTDGEKLKEPSAYRSLVGSLQYLTATRPNLIFLAGLLSRFMSSPNNVHMGVTKRVLKYIRGTTDLGIWYSKTRGIKLNEYADSD